MFTIQDKNEQKVRVIVKGESSSGKTTFVKKVCSDWSTLHKNREEPVCSEVKEVLGQYDLLIPVILRLVKHGASLEDTIRDQTNLDEKKMLTLKWMLKKTERTLFVFDGLDEYNINRSSDITNVMNGNTFKHVVITSRAEPANKTQEWKQITYKEAELKGFSDEHITLYVAKFFKTSKEQEISLIAHLFKEESHLLELARNPGSLCLLCILHKDRIEIHHMNMEQLYEEYIAFLLSIWEKRQTPNCEKTPRSIILKKYKEILLKFGTLANTKANADSQKDESIDESEDNSSEVDSDIESESEEDEEEEEEEDVELSYTWDQIKESIGEDALSYGFLYKSNPSSHLESSQYLFINQSIHEFFLAYLIKYTDKLDSFTERLSKNRKFLAQEFPLTRYLLHLYMTAEEGEKFTTDIIGSKPDKLIFTVLLHLYRGYQHNEYHKTLTFSDEKHSYIYQYPCYVIRADRRHEDSLSSYNKDMIRRMNTDNKHKALTVPILQTASKQAITCGDPRYISGYDFYVYCRPDYEVTVTGQVHKLKKLCLRYVEKVGDINLQAVNDRFEVDIHCTNLHGCVGLNKPWMALICSLRMTWSNLDSADISAIADSIKACTSPTEDGLSSSCRLQKLDLRDNSLTGAGADIARIIPVCTEIDLGGCELDSGDISVIVDSIQACTRPTEGESASPCTLQKLNLSSNSLRGDVADIVRIIPLCTETALSNCELDSGDISALADGIQACTRRTGPESASLCQLQKLDLSENNLTGAGADIARIIPVCTEIDLGGCELDSGDISAIVDSIQACTSPTGPESASLYQLQKLNKLNLSDNSLTGAGADIARIISYIPLCTEINLSECKLEAGDISAIADSIQACTSPTGAESASPCRLQKMNLSSNSLRGAGADIARIIPLCTEIDLSECKLESGDISAIADSIQACTSPTGAESASPCRLQKLDLEGNSLTGAGAHIAKIMPLYAEINLYQCELEAGDISAIAEIFEACTSPTGAESASPCRLQKLDLGGNNLTGAAADIARTISLCTEIHLAECNLNDEDVLAIVHAIIQTHSDRHSSVHDHRTPASPGPVSHIKVLCLCDNKFSDVETVKLITLITCLLPSQT